MTRRTGLGATHPASIPLHTLERGEIPERIECSPRYYPERFLRIQPGTNEPVTASDPDFLYAAPDQAACAAFIKESRIKCAKAAKPHRKSGGCPCRVKPTTMSRCCVRA